MNNSRLENIFKSSYKQIKPNMLKSETVAAKDEQLIKTLGKSLSKYCIFNLVSLLLFLLGMVWCFIYVYIITKSPVDSFFYFLIVTILTILYAKLIIVKKFICIINNKYSAKYGVVKSKYTLTTSTSSTNKTKHYYINVNFPTDNTYISKVFTDCKTYEILNEGSNVLVVTFDNKRVYSIYVDI